MNELMIKISGVLVKYRLIKEKPKTLQEFVIQRLKGRSIEYEDFWALKSIDLEVYKGKASV